MENTKYIEFFDGGTEPEISRLGGKCASLVSMTAAGMPVPPGFALTTDHYDAFLEAAGIRETIRTLLGGIQHDDVAHVEEVSARIRDEICSKPVPSWLRSQMIEAYESLQARFDQPVPLAVRSSATAEDLPEASFAGAADTFLWLTDCQSVLDHVRKCWASLYTARAILYRLRNGIAEEGLSMAVAVQKMVNAEAAGVAMTLDPSTGDRSKITVDASYGVGEMVVSGQVTPDNIKLDKVTLGVVSEHLGDKHAELVPDPQRGTLVEHEVDEERRRRRCIDDDQLRQVAEIAKRAEQHYGCPQDVEWAFDRDLPRGSNLLLLQSRPETVHSTKETQAAPTTDTGPLGVISERVGSADAAAVKSFPSPFSVETPAGAEGWEQLYPYYLVFQEALKDQDGEEFWFQNSQQWPVVVKPFETIGCEFAIRQLGEYNARHLMIPTANGIDYRIHQGYLYMSPIAVPEDQVANRVALFEERAGYYFENWEPLLEKWYEKVISTIREMEAIEFTALPDVVPLEDLTAGKGEGGAEKLFQSYEQLIDLCFRNWQYHFEFLNLGYIAYLDFFGFCKEVFPDIPDQNVATMVQGEDMELFRPDDELKKLAVSAVDIGLSDLFDTPQDPEGTLERIAAAEGGAQWLAQLEEAKDPWFNFTVGNGFYGHDRYWIDHMDIPLGFIADYIRRAQNGVQLIRPTEELVAERERIIGEYRDLLSADQQGTFDQKIALARTAYPYVENHNFYIEHWTMGTFWRKVRGLSELFVAAGFWSEPDDILYLGREEVRVALFDLINAWGIGSQQPIGPAYWSAEIPRRAGIIDALKAHRAAPAFNTPPEFITEPFTTMLYGITTDQVAQWLGQDEQPEGVFTGMAASPGVVEGIARVVTSADELGSLNDGEILVAPNTAPSWGPVFGKIKATVTDIGGMMSHAAIVCREYGLPAVTGAGSASLEIRTGQRLRVDGTTGVVTVLDAAAEPDATQPADLEAAS